MIGNKEFEYTDGIEIERCVTNNTNAVDEFICPICHKIFYSPVSCAKCENHFCRHCITTWQAKNGVKCPFSCEFKERPSSKLMNTLLSKLSIRCRNCDNGCPNISPYEAIFKHEKACEFKGTSCKFCKASLTSETKKNHMENECVLAMKALISELREEVSKYKFEAENEKKLRVEMEKSLKNAGALSLEKLGSSKSVGDWGLLDNENSTNSVTPEQKLKVFYDWLGGRGFKFKNIDIIFQENEFMIFAKEALNKGDEIMFIPRSQMISFSSIENSDIARSLSRYTSFNGITLQQPQKLALTLYLINEKLTGSNISPYLDMQPHFNQQSSLLFDETELHYLKGSALFEEIRVSKEEMRKDWKVAREIIKGLRYSDFTWAYLNVFNKNFMPQKQNNDIHVLPLLDLILPDVPDNNQTSLEYVSSLDGYRLVANKTILKNRRIFNSNLRLSNQELIKRYGVTFENNNLDTFEIYLFFNDFDPLINYKIEVFENKDEPYTFKLRNSFALDNIGQLLSYLRIIECKDKNEIKKSSTFYAKNAISSENEKKVFKKLELIFKSKLKNYETDMEQDEELLRSNTLSLNQKHCVFIRYNEKKIISNFINFSEAVQAVLNKTMVKGKINLDISEYLKSVEKII